MDERERPLVLVADDEADVLELVALHLERAHFDVVRASDGNEAMELAQVMRPDVAVLDVMMPGLNGYELVSRMRETHETAGIPVLLLTARAGQLDMVQGYRAGADEYMKKPFSPHDLVDRVRDMLKRGRDARD
ncbi:MAG: response regulator transcription factor [Thermoleophilaceae bacterium]